MGSSLRRKAAVISAVSSSCDLLAPLQGSEANTAPQQPTRALPLRGTNLGQRPDLKGFCSPSAARPAPCSLGQTTNGLATGAAKCGGRGGLRTPAPAARRRRGSRWSSRRRTTNGMVSGGGPRTLRRDLPAKPFFDQMGATAWRQGSRRWVGAGARRSWHKLELAPPYEGRLTLPGLA